MPWKGTSPAEFARRCKAQIKGVKTESVQMLAVEMSTTVNEGGRVPVKTGNLSRSVLIAPTIPMVKPSETVFSQQEFAAAAAGFADADVIYLGWQAAYARRQNSGFVGEDSLGRSYNQPGYGFHEAAIAKWPQILAAANAKVSAKMGAK